MKFDLLRYIIYPGAKCLCLLVFSIHIRNNLGRSFRVSKDSECGARNVAQPNNRSRLSIFWHLTVKEFKGRDMCNMILFIRVPRPRDAGTL